MHNEPEPLQDLVDALKRLPGVGVKSARRMAYYMLQSDPKGALQLSQALSQAIDLLKHCQMCNGFTQLDICETCSNPKRDPSVLCIVENPSDLNAIEASHGYKGLYYVLMGRLAPLEGVGPNQLGFKQLLNRVNNGTVKEVILATNFTAEGETTAHYLSELIKEKEIKVTRIARGIPAGGELEYVDASTVAWAVLQRG